ncbi:HesA/MoeB/ThiF family protein [Desulfuromonas acetexigens]|uniref:HesA/MoeB/ThiF family protein n=1 Tax=Trichloromonas acetexigens TaxID=38815 RepID=A0A550J8A9_9BACT|nr:ThiF family adenylyltransferase [Desulfuromonas acetexigens]TRO79312.1 HesA/MoeB/ThiF family protein [Desulfuromonas acetexigens]
MSGNPSQRYARQLPVWGEQRQRRLARSTVLVGGVGGLGATVAQLLARAGVGRLYLVDDGRVDWPDLNRQTLYGEGDIGRAKLSVAAERLAAINSTVEVIPLTGRIDEAFALPAGIEVVADCLDNWPSRFALHRAAPVGVWFVHGAVQGEQGQVLTLKVGASQPLARIFAGLAQPPGSLPVTPDGAAIIAGLMTNEIFAVLGDAPKLLDRILVVGLGDLHSAFLEV